ncbi:MAG: hypothetical protein U0271_48795 [Polyangiaceae bacterium]
MTSAQAGFDGARPLREVGMPPRDGAMPSDASASRHVLVVASALLGTATAISFLAEGFSTGGTRVYVDLGPGSLQLRGSF